MTATTQPKMVGPVLRGADAEMAEAIIEAIEIDNPDREVRVDDQRGYIRVSCPERCRLTRQTLAEVLDRDLDIAEVEPALSAFAGRMQMTDDEIVWYLERKD
ncbi:MAG TPA: monooxygenase [Actinobacteria bacterium]|nr:monooxygenase [Actinomycetota bacterium]